MQKILYKRLKNIFPRRWWDQDLCKRAEAIFKKKSKLKIYENNSYIHLAYLLLVFGILLYQYVNIP
jgi:hypothetical protein